LQTPQLLTVYRQVDLNLIIALYPDGFHYARQDHLWLGTAHLDNLNVK